MRNLRACLSTCSWWKPCGGKIRLVENDFWNSSRIFRKANDYRDLCTRTWRMQSERNCVRVVRALTRSPSVRTRYGSYGCMVITLWHHVGGKGENTRRRRNDYSTATPHSQQRTMVPLPKPWHCSYHCFHPSRKRKRGISNTLYVLTINTTCEGQSKSQRVPLLHY